MKFRIGVMNSREFDAIGNFLVLEFEGWVDCKFESVFE